jgi:hypothetical protein
MGRPIVGGAAFRTMEPDVVPAVPVEVGYEGDLVRIAEGICGEGDAEAGAA